MTDGKISKTWGINDLISQILMLILACFLTRHSWVIFLSKNRLRIVVYNLKN